MAFLELKSLNISIGNRTVCRDLNVTVQPRECWALLGRNGSGKTTLLHSLIALHKPDAGDIVINGADINTFKRPQLARQVGILFQEGMSTMPSTVLESVLLGRHPHAQSLLRDDPADLEIACQALASFDLQDFAARQISSLSGGEKQRLALATLLAQTPDMYLLDEPSNHLDLAFQVILHQQLEQKCREDKACVVMATHDINLAARFCNKFILLFGDGQALIGDRDEVLTEEALSTAFQCQMGIIRAENTCMYYPVQVAPRQSR